MKAIAVLTACLVTSVAAAAQQDPVFSGPQPGEPLTSFQVRQATGKQAGQLVDPVQVADGKPLVIIFVHERTRPAFGLTNAVMRMVTSPGQEQVTGAAVFLSADPTEAENWMKRIPQYFPQGMILGVSPDGQEGPGAYGLNRNVTLTVLVASKNQVTANFALVQPSLQTDGQKILKAIVDATGGGEVPDIAKFSNQAMNRRMESRRPAGDNAAMSEELTTLLRGVINKTSSDAEIETAAEAVEAYVADNEAARKDIGRRAHSIVVSGKLQNYGTAKSQEILKRWAEQYGPKAASDDSPKSDE